MVDFTIEVVDGVVSIAVNDRPLFISAEPEDFSEGSKALEVLRSLINELECLIGCCLSI